MSDKKIIAGISQGDINGIGLEVVLKSFADPQMLDICTPVIFSSQKTVNFHRKALGMEDPGFHVIKSFAEINPRKINIYSCYDDEVTIEMGKQTPAGGKYALASLEAAAFALSEGHVDILVTAPINKENIQSDQFSFPGHTEYLENRFQSSSLMFLVSDDLRVAVVTGHIPVTRVAQEVTTDKVLAKLRLVHHSLTADFSIRKPRIAVLGLNPHAGDNGVIGDEEQQIILPAIKRAKDEGMVVFGPYPADGFFGNGSYKQFDAVLAMYHDQGLIPFKTIAFHSGVNFTAGLPVVRTSPDHGTAYDLAGRNLASEESFRRAVYLGVDVFRNRTIHREISANPLKVTPGRRERAH